MSDLLSSISYLSMISCSKCGHQKFNLVGAPTLDSNPGKTTYVYECRKCKTTKF